MLSHLPGAALLFCLLEALSIPLISTRGFAQALPNPVISQYPPSVVTEVNASPASEGNRPLPQNALPGQPMTTGFAQTLPSAAISQYPSSVIEVNPPLTSEASRSLPQNALPEQPVIKFASSPEDSGDVQQELTDPTSAPLNVPVVANPHRPIRFGFGSASSDPTALRGPTRRQSVDVLSNTLSSINLGGYIGVDLDSNQDLLLNVRGGPTLFGTDLSYTVNPDFLPGTISLNVMNQQARSPSFVRGDRDVDLPNGNTPYVNRLGAGVEYSEEVAPEVEFAFGINYQLVSVRDGIFSANVEPRDEEGNRLTVSNDGQDLLLTVNAVGLYDNTDDQDFPTRGTRSRFGIDQSLPVGDASIAYTRLAGNLTQFLPFHPFNSEGYPHVLVLDVQSGTMLGDVPPYEAFNLGGGSTVRGWNRGSLGTGQSFVQATAEYRFPLLSFTAARREIGIGGTAFVDYGSDLGTANEVIGEPGRVRDKAGEGFGFGVGMNARMPFGLLRLEFALNDDGGNQFIFTVGDRF